MIDNYQLLLEQVGRIYEKHEAGRKEPFNVFTVLRKAHEEVGLHSPFLHALLNYQSPDAERQNLKSFLQKVGIKEFEQDSATVRREYKYIDILISNATSKQAVVIENKIYGGDQSKQLQRYYCTLQKEGYRDIHLLYLTLDGHDPSEDSVDKLIYTNISYRDDLLPWLKCCQMYAYDEPKLRETIAQYRHLIRKLTGTDFEEAYMNDLQELLLEGNNLVLTHDLNEAIIRTKVSLLQKLWHDIESAMNDLKDQIPCFPGKDQDASNISEERIKKYITKGSPNKQILRYKIDRKTMLGIQLERSYKDQNIYFGVFCDKAKYPKRYKKLRNALNRRRDKEWPSWQDADEDLCFKPLNKKTLKLISNVDERKEFAKGIADGLKEMWQQMKEANLA